jgi:predicted nucleotidyltransferase
MKKGNGVTRKCAEKLLEEVVDRAENINKDEKYLNYVTKIAVFGSYVNTDKDMLGDLDIAIERSNRYQGDERQDQLMKLAKSFKGSYMDGLFKAADMEFKEIKGKSKCISVHTFEEMKNELGLEEGSGYKIIYEMCSLGEE